MWKEKKKNISQDESDLSLDRSIQDSVKIKV